MNNVRTQPTANLQSVFEQFDANDDGLLDESEFRAMLERLGWNSTVEVLSLEFASIDSNEDGRVEYEEFVDWWQDRN